MTVPEGPTFDAYAERWLRRRRVRGRPLKLRTVVGYERQLRLHILPTFGQVPVAALTRVRVRTWYDALTQARGASVAAESYLLLHAICATAVEDELLPTTPCTLRGAGSRWSPERPVLTVEQVMALAQEVGPRYRAVVLFGAFCCLRMGELAALQRSAIDLDRATVTVRASAGYISGHGWVVGEPKSAASRRVVTIPTAILPDVRAHLDSYAEPGPDGAVFVGPQGGRLSSSGPFASAFHAALGRLGLTGIRFHDLRHTGNTLAASTGASLADLMARMGHADGEAALRYQHATRAQDAAVAAALSDLVATARERRSGPAA